MAGDWIKLEHATLTKPEVLKLAELLGIHRRHAIGLLCDFFAWLDVNSRDGTVTHLSSQSLDDVMQCAGFSAALSEINWGKINLSTGVLTIRHYDRHNGNPAKNRALAKDRMKRKRDADGVTNASPEKRREELLQKHVVPHPTVTGKETGKTVFDIPPKQKNNGTTPPERWDQSEQGIDAMGRRLGMIADTSDTYQTFAAKIWQRINETLRNPPHHSPP